MPRTSHDPELDPHERKCVQDVEEHGLHVLNVLPGQDTPGWSYSVGLWRSYGHPEVVVFGLDDRVGHLLLNTIAGEIRAGRPFRADGEYDSVLEGYRCAFKPVATVWYGPFFGWASWFYRGDDYPVLQCVWPDKEHHWPWELAFREKWLWSQPLLWHTDHVEARATALLESLRPPPRPEEPADGC